MAVVLSRIVIERIDPEKLLRNLVIDRPVIFPSRFETQAADRRFALPFDLHVPERGRDRLRRRGAIGQLRQSDQHVDEQILGFTIVGIIAGTQVEIRTLHGALRPRHAEQFRQGMEQRGLARRVRADDRRDLGRDRHRDRIRTETAEAGQGYRVDTHRLPSVRRQWGADRCPRSVWRDTPGN